MTENERQAACTISREETAESKNTQISNTTALLYTLFDKWLDSLIKSDKEAEEKQRKDFAVSHKVGENSTFALMYTAFVGGISAGLDIAELPQGGDS